jgi:hypothetical protein
MNDSTGGYRGSRRAGLLAAVAVVAVLATATACGGSASSSSDGSASGTDQMLAYSQCMRAHGVTDFPDPNASGNVQVAPGSLNDPMNSPQEQTAENECRHLLPGGGTSGSVDQQKVDQLLKLAQCMRANGVPNFPDPTVSGGNVTLNGSFAFNSPQFQKAERACKSVTPAGLFPSAS